MIYLDNHTVTKPCQSALDRMRPFFEKDWGSSGSLHQMGQELISQIDGRYQTIYDFIEADPKDQFVFCSSNQEAIHQIFWSVFMKVSRVEGKSHFIISAIEDAATMRCAKMLEELGCTIHIAPLTEEGTIDLEALKELINPRTALISITAASGITGVIQPFEEIAAIAQEKGVLFHLDANYAAGRIPLFFVSDYLSFSGEQLHSVKGSAALFAKEKAPLIAYIAGGTEQNGLRGGSLDVPSFMAFVAAIQQAELYLDVMALEVVRLRDLFESQILGGKVLYQTSFRLPSASLIAFEGVHQEAFLYYLNRKGICASIGGGGVQRISQIDETAISFTLSRMTTESEVLLAAKIINTTFQELKHLSEAL